MPDTTIYAPSSGEGSAGIAIIRLSGPEAHSVISELTDRALPEPRRLELRRVLDRNGAVIDHSMIVVFSEGASYTKEPMAEIHCHGSRAVVAEICDRLSLIENCKLAEPGEFTRRAMLNGAMDLVDVEALSDLVRAETSLQRKQAMRIMEGDLHRRLEGWRARLLQARAMLELTIDWVDEEIPEDVLPDVDAHLTEVLTEALDELQRSERTDRLRAGFFVAILGAPNVGKSSLLNALSGRDVAIVSGTPGTTRDAIEVRCDLDGLPVTFIDTAGLRETTDDVEQIGIERAKQRAIDADLCLWLRSSDTSESLVRGDLPVQTTLEVWSKSDLEDGGIGMSISSRTGQGMDDLLAAVKHELTAHSTEFGLLGHFRQREAIAGMCRCISLCRERLQSESVEVSAQHLIDASGFLERLTGRMGTEDMLDALFSSFCLGK